MSQAVLPSERVRSLVRDLEHGLRSPLTPVRGWLDLAREALNDGDAKAAGEHLTFLARDLTAYESRVRALIETVRRDLGDL